MAHIRPQCLQIVPTLGYLEPYRVRAFLSKKFKTAAVGGSRKVRVHPPCDERLTGLPVCKSMLSSECRCSICEGKALLAPGHRL